MKYSKAINFIESLIEKVENDKVRKINMRFTNRDIIAKYFSTDGDCSFLTSNLGFKVNTLVKDYLDYNQVGIEKIITRLFTSYYGESMTNKEWAENAKEVLSKIKEVI